MESIVYDREYIPEEKKNLEYILYLGQSTRESEKVQAESVLKVYTKQLRMHFKWAILSVGSRNCIS